MLRKGRRGEWGERIYIHDSSADSSAVRHTIRHTSENHRYTIPHQGRAPARLVSSMPCYHATFSARGPGLCGYRWWNSSTACSSFTASASYQSGSAYPNHFTKYFSFLPLPNSLASRISSTTNSSSSFTITRGEGGTSCPRYGFSAAFSRRETW